MKGGQSAPIVIGLISAFLLVGKVTAIEKCCPPEEILLVRASPAGDMDVRGLDGTHEKEGFEDQAVSDMGRVLQLAICGRKSCVISEPPSPPPQRDPSPRTPPTPGPTLPPQEPEWQRLQRESTNANNRGVEYHNRGDYDKAIQFYEEALRLNPNNATAKSNLRKARTEKANKIGLGHYNRGDYEKAIQSYEEALRFDPNDPVAQQKLREVKSALAERQARAKIGQMVDDLKREFSSSATPASSLDFMGPGQPLHSPGTKESAPVDLTFMDPSKPQVVDPSKVKGASTKGEEKPKDGLPSEKDLKIAEVPKPSSTYDPYFNKSRAEIILDAIDKSRGQGTFQDRRKPGDWLKSIDSLKNYLDKVNPDNANAQEALSYIEGIYGYSYVEEQKHAKQTKAQPQDVISQSLLEAVSQAGRRRWPGPTYNPERIDVGPNPLNWRQKRDFAIGEALIAGKGNFEASIRSLETKIKTNPGDTGARTALQFLQGYTGRER